MGSRLLPLSFVLGAVVADALGTHRIGGWLVLLAIPFGFAAVAEAVGERGWLRSLTSSGALVCLLVGSAVRHAAPTGAAVPAFALSAAIGAAILYVLPVLLWLVQPTPQPAPSPTA
jgi:hypothetical protein